MSNTELKPLNWTPTPGIGYSVERRPDGGMNFTFTDLNQETLNHWRNFALQHLYDSDRLTRNLYDLRQISHIPEDAVRFAIEANSDPSARNIRVAVVFQSDTVRAAIRQIASLTIPTGVELKSFTDIDEAEAWLSRPLNLMV